LGVGMCPKNFADAEARLLGTGAGQTPRNTRVTMPNSVMLRSNCTTVIMEIRMEWLRKSAVACRLSRSLQVIGTDRGRSATYDFLLVIIETMGLPRTVSVIKSDDCNILPVRVFIVRRGVPLETLLRQWDSKKLEWCPY